MIILFKGGNGDSTNINNNNAVSGGLGAGSNFNNNNVVNAKNITTTQQMLFYEMDLLDVDVC